MFRPTMAIFKEVVFKEKFGWECRRLHNEEFYDLYSSPNIIRVIK
jgi:hypothetical protein